MTQLWNKSIDEFETLTDIPDEDRERLQSLTDKNKPEMDCADLTQLVNLAIRRKYTYPEWALFFEFHAKDRRVDAVAFNLYPSRNFKTVGFEVKASRSDWKKELKDVSKADYFVRQCDQFYVVAAHKDIVREKELPDGWGLYEMKGGGKLYETVEPDPTPHQQRGTDREFFMRAVKNAMEERQDLYKGLHRMRRRGYREGKEEAKEKLMAEIKRDEIPNEMQREMQELREKAENYEQLKDAGLHVYSEKDIERLKRAKTLMRKVDASGFGSVEDAIDQIRKHADRLEELHDLATEKFTEAAESDAEVSNAE